MKTGLQEFSEWFKKNGAENPSFDRIKEKLNEEKSNHFISNKYTKTGELK